MSPQRRGEGVIVHGASEGVVRVLREIVLETLTGSEAVVISDVPIGVGERVRLLFHDGNARTQLEGCVAGAELTSVNGSLCHRLTIVGEVAVLHDPGASLRPA